MIIAALVSLFDVSGEPVVETAGEWLASLFTGSLALSLCTIAIALVGMGLFVGRVSLRESARIVLGCFVLLGASSIAAGIGQATDHAELGMKEVAMTTLRSPPRDLPPADYDPYAGASLLQD